uniref:Uncharacterized protein n=1 Tax=Caenorhabditis japonica TaxID=281687 RepID=A0A8R1IF16_CAEJA
MQKAETILLSQTDHTENAIGFKFGEQLNKTSFEKNFGTGDDYYMETVALALWAGAQSCWGLAFPIVFIGLLFCP